jgi:hypothetical protein
MYQKGLGIPQDYAMAEQWYQQSAEQDNALGHRKLCRLYIIQEQFEAAEKIACPSIDESSVSAKIESNPILTITTRFHVPQRADEAYNEFTLVCRQLC